MVVIFEVHIEQEVIITVKSTENEKYCKIIYEVIDDEYFKERKAFTNDFYTNVKTSK